MRKRITRASTRWCSLRLPLITSSLFRTTGFGKVCTANVVLNVPFGQIRTMSFREGLHNLRRERIAALRGARSLASLIVMSRSLRSMRLTLRPLATVVQTFPNEASYL